MARAVLDIRTLARSHTDTAIRTLAGIMRQKGAPPAARVAAAGLLLDRGWGKAPQDLSVDGEIRITIRKMIEATDLLEENTVIDQAIAASDEDER